MEMHRLQEMVRLHRMEMGYRETARLLGMSPNTERPYREALQAAGLLDGKADALPALDVLKAAVLKHHPPKPAQQELSSIETWIDKVRALMDKGLKPRALFDRLREEETTFSGSYWAVKRLYRRLRKARGVQPDEIAIPVDTQPGEIAQVDFGYVGWLYDPQTERKRKAWVFVMVLGYSRHMWAKVVFDQRTETWLSLHIEAFAHLGGSVETVVPDNLKAAVIRAAFAVGGETALNRSYRELARHYGFKVDPAPAYQPKKKGKVEAGVRYVKGNFFAGRQGESVDEVQPKLEQWVRNIAGTRIHGTTGDQPIEVFQTIEQATLKPLPKTRFELVVWKQVTVRDAYVPFDRRLYSVPFRLSGSQVWIRATPKTVTIYADDTRVATHGRNDPGRRSTNEVHLPEGRRDLRHRSRAYWEQRADALGTDVGRYIREVFDSDDVLSRLGAVQTMVMLLERIPSKRARAACRRAAFYGNYEVRALRSILAKGLDQEPLPVLVMPAETGLEPPRFARRISELWHAPVEVTHEPH
jgi:transposase